MYVPQVPVLLPGQACIEMAQPENSPRVASKLISDLNRVDYTIGGLMLLGVIMFLLAGSFLARPEGNILQGGVLMIYGLVLLLFRSKFVRLRKKVLLSKYGLECRHCGNTPRDNIEARQALKTSQCPHCRHIYF